MKRLLLLLDGAAEGPLEELGNRTPLEVADVTLLHRLAREGTVGWTVTTPLGVPVQPEGAALEALGYDSPSFYTGRGAFRALGADVPLSPRDIAFTATFLATDGETIIATDVPLTPQEARRLLTYLQERLGERRWHFVPLRASRHVLLWHEGRGRLYCDPPDELAGEPLWPHLPRGDGDRFLHQLLYDALELLDRHELNRRRRDEGLPPANLLWVYEPGIFPRLPPFRLQAGMIRADMVTDHIPMRGLAIAAGIRPHRPLTVRIEELSADYEALADFVTDLLPDTDFLLIHLREPDKAAHQKDPDLKIFVLRRFGEVFLPRLLEALGRYDDIRLLILPSHRTSSATGKHEEGEVPFLLVPRKVPTGADEFHEAAAKEMGVKIDRAAELARWFLDIPSPIGF